MPERTLQRTRPAAAPARRAGGCPAPPGGRGAAAVVGRRGRERATRGREARASSKNSAMTQPCRRSRRPSAMISSRSLSGSSAGLRGSVRSIHSPPTSTPREGAPGRDHGPARGSRAVSRGARASLAWSLPRLSSDGSPRPCGCPGTLHRGRFDPLPGWRGPVAPHRAGRGRR